MPTSHRHSGFLSFAMFITAAVAVLAVAAFAYRPDLGPGSIALSIGTAPPIREASLARHADPVAVDQLAVFLERWTSTAASK